MGQKIYNGKKWIYYMEPLPKNIKNWSYGQLIQYRENYNLIQNVVCSIDDIKNEIKFRKEKYKRIPIPKKLRYEIMQRDNWTCQLCRNTKYPLEIDHIMSIKKGETMPMDVNDPSNLWTLCCLCNAGKREK